MEFLLALLLIIVFAVSSYRFSSKSNAFHSQLEQALIKDNKIIPNDIKSFEDYLYPRIPFGYLTYKIDKLYDFDDSIELREVKTKIVKTVKRERILPFIIGCIHIVYFIDILFF